MSRAEIISEIPKLSDEARREIMRCIIAIVSYLSSDERFLPSTSFVVDPPTMPEEVKPDAETSSLLHFEKVLQYAGLPQTAKEYLATLSHQLREKHRMLGSGSDSVSRTPRIETVREELRERFVEETQPRGLETRRHHDLEFLGRTATIPTSNLKVFFGAQRQVLEMGVRFEAVAQKPETQVTQSPGEIISTFSDGTILQLTELNGGKA